MSDTSTTGRAALVAANGRARRPAEPPQGELSHADALRGGERRDFWFGEVPDGWEVRKIKFTFSERKQKGYPELPLLAATQNHGVILKNKYENRTVEAIKGLESLKLVEIGDFVISLRSFQGGLELAYDRGIISPAYTILMPTHITREYFKYYAKSPTFIALLRSTVTGIREGQNIDYNKLREYSIPIPPKETQLTIAAYLDAETGRIDKAIAAEERMIALLQERREIVINEAVAPHDGWEVRRLGTIGEFSKGGGISRDDLQESGLPAILYGDIYTKYNHAVVEVKNHISDRTAKGSVSVEYGDILMTGSGETKEDIGKAVVFLGDSSFIGGDVICFRQKDNNSCYLSYALSSEAAKAFRYRESKGEIVVHIYASSLKQLPIPLPHLPEQEAIVERLDRETGKIDRAIEVKRRQIELLRERRQIVIDEAVTGKVKVA